MKASVLAIAMLGAPMLASAAGIGKITVLSALGQPLRAEIELSATKDELNSLSVKLATSDQFRQQGVEFSPALSLVQLSIDKRANGQPYVRMTSERPINEPFLDALIEMTWASGRLVREYTFLLDPIDLPKPGSASINAPVVSSAPIIQPTVVPSTTKAAKATKRTKSVDTASAPAKSAPSPKVEANTEPAPKADSTEASASASGMTREVKRGDTLGKIAAETAPDGVSLDQMLVAIFSANRDAFAGENLNRLKTGRILNIPDRDAAVAVSDSEARKTVAVHAQNFNAYRNQLAEAAASAPVSKEATTQSASGKITPKVEEKTPAPVGKDKLEVSRSEAAKDGGKSAKVAEEDKIAREKALKEAQSRVAELEKNVSDLKKLNEIKSQSLAEAEKKAQAAKSAPAPTPAPAPVIAAKPVEPAKPEVKVAEAPKAEVKAEVKPEAKVEEKPAEVKPEEPAKPAEPVAAEKPAEPVPPPAPPKKKIVIPEPEPEPSFMEENGMFVYLGGALVALLGGFFGFREWKKRKEGDLEQSSQFGDVSSASSVFGTSGGQSVDTNNVSLGSGFSQTSLTGNEGTAGVDPVAEAEVYMAYGRDAQAEEILLEALKAEPTRHAVHVKLLELYAARKSVKPFEEVARDLQQQTGGSGPAWDKAVTLGQSIDPSNPLYSGAAKSSEDDTGAFNSFGTSTVIMPPGQLAKMVAGGAAAAAADNSMLETLKLDEPVAEPTAEEPVAAAPVMDFDLDLGSGDASPAAAEAAPTTLDFDLDLGATAAPTAAPALPTDLSLDLDAPSISQEAAADTTLDFEVPSISPAEAPSAPSGGLDIEFDLGLPATDASAAAAPAAGNGVDFDFNLDTPAVDSIPDIPAPAAGSLAPTVDFSSINLDLETPAAASAEAPADLAAEAEDNPEVTTKLELAQAYEEMGDKEGMRELLQEVLTEGTAAQQELARSKLAQHGL
ncbi:MAG TPA: FimV/HubP family polar landmark protein [Rhodocyclaceae bacterium]|nr:FimV/HubP family polar landmark protein [Rhodocyclaceae bacterium]